MQVLLRIIALSAFFMSMALAKYQTYTVTGEVTLGPRHPDVTCLFARRDADIKASNHCSTYGLRPYGLRFGQCLAAPSEENENHVNSSITFTYYCN